MLKRLLTVSLLAAGCGGPKEVAAPVIAEPSTNVGADREKYAKSQGLELRSFDLNHDGQPDVFKFFSSIDDPQNPGNKLEQLARKELDLNHDGKIDIIRLYDDKQAVSEERADLDFDGRIDSVSTYRAGKIVRRTIDVDYDDKPDVTKFYDDGKLEHIESDRNDDGQVDTWEYFVGGELDRVGVDSDGDGEADKWERKREETAAAAEAPAAEIAAAPGEPVPAGSEAVVAPPVNTPAATSQAAPAEPPRPAP